ncbi:hypothetical protein FHETE_9636 [Fusarium heterosporum]|uniref:Uncharacterized protein n=1 Tax=Fusarium heterosporum TaxID=42747 RepID=A0A8H5SWR8_FUSHE|nr:hypothetical protein FHETE_9636 [Fusarium heterosporum]
MQNDDDLVLVMNENKDIADLIKNMAAGDYSDKQIKNVLSRLLSNIKIHPTKHIRTTDNVIYDVWRSYFKPINALRQLREGNFLAARMTLFLGNIFVYTHGVSNRFHGNADSEAQKSARLYGFCTELDDILLGHLTAFWTSGAGIETFDWVFTDQIRQVGRSIDEMLSPQDLMRVISPEANGHTFFYKRSRSDHDWTLYDGPMPRWDNGDGDTDKFYWKVDGSDGPIRQRVFYSLVNDDGRQHSKYIWIFTRSRQFCFDARQISEARLGRQRHELVDKILVRQKIPREIQALILEYLPYREEFPYLRDLDIAKAYAPFPEVGEWCLSCEDLVIDSSIKCTCPRQTLHVWNLALRRFHTFHMTGFNKWSLCVHGIDCPGHHDRKDNEWVVDTNAAFIKYVEKEVAKENGLSLDQAGFGPADKIILKDRAEDQKRRRRLNKGAGIYKDAMEEWRVMGGLGGLVNCMLHGRVIIGGYRTGVSNRLAKCTDRYKTISAEWALGENLIATRIAQRTISDFHTSQGTCEFCQWS